MESLWQDLRFGVRTLRRRPAFAVAAIVTLALGIGVNATIFSFVNAVLLRTPPVADADRLVWVFSSREDQPYGSVSYLNYVDLRDGTRALTGLAAFGRTPVSLGGDSAEQVPASVVSGNYFQVLGVEAALGRVLSPADDQTRGGHPVAVIGHALWQRRFAGDPAIVGREVRLNGHLFSIVGVTPAGFRGPEILEANDLWVPLAMQPVVRPPRAGFAGEQDPDLLARRQGGWLQLVGRLAPGATQATAEAELAGIARRLADAYPETNRGRSVALFPVRKVHPLAYRTLVTIAALLMAAVAMVLLATCANVGNLVLTRALARRREVALRVALGAGPGRVVRQLLVEGLALAACGGAAGLLLGRWTVDLLRGAAPGSGMFSFTLDVPLDARVAAFTALVSLATVLLFGLAPALQAARTDVVPVLKASGPGAETGGARRGLREALVVVQVALSMVLLAGAGLFVRSAAFAQSIDPGFDADRVLVTPLDIHLLRYTTAQGRAFYGDVLEKVGALPGVETASLARTVPVSGGGRRTGLEIQSRPAARDGEPREAVDTNVVGPDYFRTLGIQLLRGRDFVETDRSDAPRVVVVNEAFTRRHFADREPLGERISLDGPNGPWREVVGVARDSRYRRLTEDQLPYVYQPLSQQHETGVALHVRMAAGAPPPVAALRGVLRGLEPDLPLAEVQPLSEILRGSLFPARMAAWLFLALAALALTLALVGIYGVVSYVVSLRTREIGIRMALGARASHVARLVLAQGMTLVAAGLVLGLAAAVAFARLVRGLLFGVGPADPGTFAAVAAILAVVGLGSCAAPLRRALRLDAASALRQD